MFEAGLAAAIQNLALYAHCKATATLAIRLTTCGTNFEPAASVAGVAQP